MKVYLDTVGCRLNQAEIEYYARQFHAAGHTLVADPQEADLAVVNTCAVTSAAAADSRKKIRHISRAGVDEIIATGCWSTLRPEDAARLPGVRRVVPNAEKDRLVPDLLQISEEVFDREMLERELIPGARLRTRAFIKVQDGCNNRCTFCITTVARGEGRSRTIAAVLEDIQAVLQPGEHGEEAAQEVVITGVHLGSWGQDLEPQTHLKELVTAILRETDVPRLRLSSLEPWDLDESFFSLWSDPRLCRHLHLPLQSGSAATLRRMARKTTPESFSRLLQQARAAIPDVAITTDIITGFPGETDEEFEETLEYVRAAQFAGGHVFTYSARSGTAAARMPNQVPYPVRKERNARLRAVLAESARAYQEKHLGQVLPVLWESATALGPEGWVLNGLTDSYIKVRAVAPQRLWNQITPVRLTGWFEEGMQGQLAL
ncbi:MAG: MiaB/RimO family radical SAM methylthiotransferase [Chloroflexi bacterium]|nr:MiaB/RimO family radical SAM methylthiotransferase [Chloroflexota bacterium]